jgi:hypothetical protein
VYPGAKMLEGIVTKVEMNQLDDVGVSLIATRSTI